MKILPVYIFQIFYICLQIFFLFRLVKMGMWHVDGAASPDWKNKGSTWLTSWWLPIFYCRETIMPRLPYCSGELMHPSIHPSIHPSFLPSIHHQPTNQPTNSLPIYQSIYLALSWWFIYCNDTKYSLQISRFLGMRIVSQRTFSDIQRLYCVPAIQSFWDDVNSATLNRFQGQPLIVAGKRHLLTLLKKTNNI